MADDDKLDPSKEVKKAEEAAHKPKNVAATKGAAKKKAAKKKTAKKRVAAKKKNSSKAQPKEETVAQAAPTVDPVPTSQEEPMAQQNIQDRPEETTPLAAAEVASNTSKGMSFWPKTLVWVVLVIAGFLFLRYLAHDPSKRIGMTKDPAKTAPDSLVRKEASKETGQSGPDAPKMITDSGLGITPSSEFQSSSTADDATTEPAPQIIDSARYSSAPTGLVKRPTVNKSVGEAKSGVNQVENMGSTLNETMPEVAPVPGQEASKSVMNDRAAGAIKPIEADMKPAINVQSGEKNADDAMTQAEGRMGATPDSKATLPGATVYRSRIGTTLPGASITRPPVGATQPGASVFRPQAEATLPRASVARPPVGATQPGASITRPRVGATQPGASVFRPQAEATPPGASVATPQTTTPPGGSAATPETGVTTPAESLFTTMRARPPVTTAKPVYPREATAAGQKREYGTTTRSRERYYGYRQQPGIQRQPALSGGQADKRSAVESRRQARMQRGAQPYYYPPSPWGYRYPTPPYGGYGGYQPYPFNRAAPAAPATNTRQ